MKSEREMSGRLVGFDILKILAAFTVVLIHTSVPNMDWQQTALACLPPANAVFGIMAGFFLWRIMDDVRAKAKMWFGRRIARLLLPYLIWESLYVVLNVSFDCLRGDSLLGWLAGCDWFGIVFAGSGSVQLWFVISLFYAQCLFVCVALLSNGTRLLMPMLAATTIGMLYWQTVLPGGTALYKFLFIGGYCGIGMMLGAIVAGNRSHVIPAGGALVAALFLNFQRAIFWVCVFYALSFVLRLCRFKGGGASLSNLTMGVYLVHVLICRVVGIVSRTKLLASYASEPYWLIVSAAVSFIVSMGLVWCFRKFKWLWGD